MSRPGLSLVAIAFSLSSLALLAQDQPPGRVLLYAEANYRGEALVVNSGSAIENLEYTRDSRGKKWNDRILSVRIEGPVVLAAYEHAGFRGAVTTITRNSADLYTLSLGDPGGKRWDKQISSLRVEPVPVGAPVVMEWNRRDADRAVRSAFRDILGRDPDEDGLRTYRGRLMDIGWSEDQLRDQLRHSAEFRQRDLAELIHRIYREVLGREPDASGVATYTRALQGGMSEAEFRADLRRSGERTAYVAREAVTRAYREVLRREPDAGGMANYTKLMLERGWDETRVRDALRKSEEFKNLPRR